MLKKIIGSMFVIISLVACTTSTYNAPIISNSEQYTFKINKSFDETWSSLVDHVSSSFFSVDNVEKSSGFISLHFGKDNPGLYVDCGLFNSNSYAKYLKIPTRPIIEVSRDERILEILP